MNQHHTCLFSEEELRALKQFCALLQNGGLKSFRALLDFGELWSKIRVTIATTLATMVLSGLGALIVFGLYWWLRTSDR